MMGIAGMPTRYRFTLRHAPLVLALVLGSVTGCRTATPPVATDVVTAATPRGSLMIVGGGPRPPDMMQRFVELAGGSAARILVMQMATAEPSTSSVTEFTARWGAANAREANLTREQAMSDTIGRIFEGVTGVWFVGGDQSRITAAMAGTPAERALHERHRAGAVIGGTSAGAAIMTSPMISGNERRPGGARPDSTLDWGVIDRNNVEAVTGLGLLPGAIVDQHFLRRRRHNRLISLVLEHPHLIGAGIDEATAIEVRPDGIWRVWGNSVVVIYDARRSGVTSTGAAVLGGRDIRMHVLPAGATFDPRTGTATLR
jgi:cyanophycinase